MALIFCSECSGLDTCHFQLQESIASLESDVSVLTAAVQEILSVITPVTVTEYGEHS